MDFSITLAPCDIKTMYNGQILHWLSTGVSSLASARRSFGELGVVVSARSLANSIRSLLNPSGDGEPSITKSDLRQLCGLDFAWPTETSVDKIVVLPKNIAKTFMHTFFKKFVYGLTVAESHCVLCKVFSFLLFFFEHIISSLLLLYLQFFLYLFFCVSQATLGSGVVPLHIVGSSGGGSGPSSAAVSSAAPPVQVSSPHEGRATDVSSGAPEV